MGGDVLMANPGKTYNLPCTYSWYFGSNNGLSYISDYVKIGGREFQIYTTVIENEV